MPTGARTVVHIQHRQVGLVRDVSDDHAIDIRRHVMSQHDGRLGECAGLDLNPSVISTLRCGEVDNHNLACLELRRYGNVHDAGSPRASPSRGQVYCLPTGRSLDLTRAIGRADCDERRGLSSDARPVLLSEEVRDLLDWSEAPFLLATVGDLVQIRIVGDDPRREIGGRSRGRAQPTAPSICNSIRRFNSRAYSIGNSRAMGSTKPRTIIAMASSSSSPRDIR